MNNTPREHELNEHLASESQKAMRHIVHHLPDEEPSMAWRAHLNERLRSMPQRARRAWWALAWKPTAGLALAGALTLAILVRPGSPPAVSPVQGTAVADALVAAHGQSVAQIELGMISVDALSSDQAVPSEWEEVDLGTL